MHCCVSREGLDESAKAVKGSEVKHCCCLILLKRIMYDYWKKSGDLAIKLPMSR